MNNLFNRHKLKYVSFLPLIISAAVLLLLTFCGCNSFQVTTYYSNGAVATGAPIATELGLEILKKGGNAFDAAVAIGFLLAVVQPEAGNIGGGGFALIRDGKSGEIISLDFRETAPGKAHETIYQDSTGEIIPGLSTVGSMAVGVPGTVAGLHELWRKYGSLPWADLVHPSAKLADSGFIVDDFLARRFADYSDDLTQFESTRNWLMTDDHIPRAGDNFRQVDLGHTLVAIAVNGPEAFYEGEIATKILACMEANNGMITSEDLASYKPVWRDPVVVMFDSLEVYGMAPPSSGGFLVGQILKLIEPYDLSIMTPKDPRFAHLFAECSRRAFADRATHLGDPDFWNVPGHLLEESYLDRRRNSIRPEQASSSDEISAGNPIPRESDETTHFSVADKDGNLVAITYTLNARFGSKLVVDRAGFLLNNEMDDFSTKTGHPNIFGLVGAEANKVEPGKRMLSSMSPTIVLRQGEPYLVLGSPGGSRIITAVAQTILNIVRFDMSPEEAVAFPRVHHQWLPDQIRLEQGSFDVAFKQSLIRYGHFIEERPPHGDIELIMIDHSGIMTPASDPRQRGLSSGF